MKNNLVSMTKYIAIGSIGRSGKDSLAQLMKEDLESRGFYVIKKSLAEPLKNICNDFLIKNFNISAFTEDTVEKSSIRPFLVCVGSMLRSESEGSYFTKILFDYVQSLKRTPDFVIVPDLRYSEYEGTDEIDFFKNLNSFIININRVDYSNNNIEPANNDEKINSVKIKRQCNLDVTWPTYGTSSCEQMQEFAKNCVNTTLKYFGE